MDLPNQTANRVTKVWYERKEISFPLSASGAIYLGAYFNCDKRWGVITICSGTDEIDLVAVMSKDYRDTIARAQELWAEKEDEYMELAIKMKTERKNKNE